jgi:hypothetical protein
MIGELMRTLPLDFSLHVVAQGFIILVEGTIPWVLDGVSSWETRMDVDGLTDAWTNACHFNPFFNTQQE